MNKQFQVLVGGVEMFTGSFGDAVAVLEASIVKPRYESAKAAIEASDVGASFKVTSRIKGSTQKAMLVVVAGTETAEEIEVALKEIEAQIEARQQAAAEMKVEMDIGTVLGDAQATEPTVEQNEEHLAETIKEIAETQEQMEPAPVAFKKSGNPMNVRTASWKYITEQMAALFGTESIYSVEVRTVTEKRHLVLVNDKVVWYSFKKDVAEAAAAAITEVYKKAA